MKAPRKEMLRWIGQNADISYAYFFYAFFCLVLYICLAYFKLRAENLQDLTGIMSKKKWLKFKKCRNLSDIITV